MRHLLFAVILLAVPLSAIAQTTPEHVTLRGAVLDSTRAPIPGADVTATPDSGDPASSTRTDQSGQFMLTVPPSTYTVRIRARGFLESSRRLVAGDNTDVSEFVLQVAGVRETVNVSAPATYDVPAISTATRTLTPLRDVPQSVTVVSQELIKDQLMMSIGDVVQYVPGISAHQGENNRDEVIIRGNRSSADFFVNGVRDDVRYYRDLYNLERVEALKGPNAMIFGRGGGGGVVNRVVKEPGFMPVRAFTVQAGGFGNKRATIDLDQPLSDTVAFRLNGMTEESDSFRRFVGLKRAAINPTLTVKPGSRTKVTIGYEYLRDTRVADRGITSFEGRPAAVDASTFYGNPDESRVRARVNLGSASIEHRRGNVILRNHTMIGGYDGFYQNFVPGAPTADRTFVTLTAYNNAATRTNIFNQTDVVYGASTGRVRHTIVAGTEIGRQSTDNFRNSGFFNNVAASIQVPFANPVINTPVVFRQSASDANNHVRTNIAAAFAQDQVELSRRVQVLGGARFDRFDLQYHNNRNGDALSRVDHLVSPRAGLILKPIETLSVYTSYGISYLPSAGDQFSSLTTITQQVRPEKFSNNEVGAKWSPSPSLSLTTAVYRLDRTNTRSTDPNDPTRIVQTGSQRTNGYELGINGAITPRWKIAGGYAYQNAFVTSATTAARAGAQVAQVPHHTFAVWNNYQIHPRVAASVGVLRRSDMFATIDNSVTLPAHTRADAAAYVSLSKHLRLQANVENVFDIKYYVNADSNTNISPGFPRTLRVALTGRF